MDEGKGNVSCQGPRDCGWHESGLSWNEAFSSLSAAERKVVWDSVCLQTTLAPGGCRAMGLKVEMTALTGYFSLK